MNAAPPAEAWLRTFQMTGHGIMSCHWRDIERGHVVPKYAGQQFHFVDLDGFWMYLGEIEPEPPRQLNWAAITVILLFVLFFAIDLALAWYLLHRLEWL